MEENFQPRTDLSGITASVEKINSEIKKVIVGQQEMIDLLITALFSGGHILIEGVPGIAKTLTAKLLAKTINTGFSRIQFTPDLMPSDILGTTVFNTKESEFVFKKGPIFSNIVLIDEINRAPAKTQAALFEVMQERQVTVDGTTYKMDEPFIVIATQNPIELEGTYRLPEAQIDRFLFKINVTYPNLDEEVEILNGFHTNKIVNESDSVTPVVEANEISENRKKLYDVVIEEHLLTYIAELVQSTRKNKFIYLGASPRASLAIMNSSKAFALINGRDFVTPEDIKTVAYPVLRHRIILTPEKEMEGTEPDEIIKMIINSVEVPR